MSAWCHKNGLILGEEQVAAKTNEITAIPLLIESLEVKGTTITYRCCWMSEIHCSLG